MSDDSFVPVPVLDTSGFTANSVQSSAFSSPNKNVNVAEKRDVIQLQPKNDAYDRQKQPHNRSSYYSLTKNSKISVLDSPSSKKQHSTFSELLKVDTYRGEVLSSERQEIREGLHSMKSKIDGLETDKKRMAKNLEALRRGLDKYSDLLAKGNQLEEENNRLGKNPLESTNNGRKSSQSTTNGDILNDSAIQKIYGNLRQRLSAMEAYNSNINKENRPRTISSSSSCEVERAAPFVSRSNFKMPLEPDFEPKVADTSADKYSQSHKTIVPPLNINLASSSSGAETGESRPHSSLNRSIQSQKLNLTDDQRRNLSQLRDKILAGQILASAASSSPVPPAATGEQLKNQSAQCDTFFKNVSMIDKSAQNGRSLLNDRRDQSTSILPSVSREQQSFHGLADGRLDYDKLHRQLRDLKEKATIAAANLPKEEKENNMPKVALENAGINKLDKNPYSPSSSPARKIKKQESAAETPHSSSSIQKWPTRKVKPAFVSAGPSMGAGSHSLLANVQELFSLLKRQNPALHQTALKMYETCGFDGLSSAENLIRNFGAELRMLKKKAEKELKNMLKTYDQMNGDTKTDENIRKQNSLVAEMEQKDTYLQRLNCQIEWLKTLSSKTDAHKSTPVRQCRQRSASTPPAVGRARTKYGHVVRHTVSSYQRMAQQRGSSVAAGAHSHARRRAAYFAKILKEIRTAKEIVVESGVIKV